MSSCVLKIKDGKFVNVQNFEDGLKLCAVDSQPNDHTVYIQKHRSYNWIAFKFNLKYENMMKGYFLKVNGLSLELVQLDQVDSDSDQVDSDSMAYWFEKHNRGGSEHYSLKTVLQPQKYVGITQRGRRPLFILSNTKQDCVEVKDEAK